MRHPFASVQYFQSSLSSESLDSPPTQPEGRTLISPTPTHGAKKVVSPLPLPPPKRPAPAGSSIDSILSARPRSALARVTPRLSLTRRKPVAVVLDTRRATDQEGSEGRTLPWSGKVSPGHFVKHSSKVTLLLSGQEENATEPVYTNESTIIGILAIPRPSGLLSLEIKVCTS